MNELGLLQGGFVVLTGLWALARVTRQMEEFKTAYAAAAVERTGLQFHMRCTVYSKEVAKALDALGARLKLFTAGGCPVASASVDSDGKFDPPGGISRRLDVLSANLRRLVTGTTWRSPIFTDSSMLDYAESLENAPGDKSDVREVW